MPYLIAQILLCLLAAFLIGVLVGWLIKRWSCRRQMDELRAELEAACQERLRAAAAARPAPPSAAGPASEPAGESQRMAAAAAALAAVPKARTRDDLKRIWGIGPRMEQLLNDVGIQSFEQVAATTVERLGDIIAGYGTKRLVDLANEETWPEQASMAARGDWDALKAYQKSLSWKSGGKPKG